MVHVLEHINEDKLYVVSGQQENFSSAVNYTGKQNGR